MLRAKLLLLPIALLAAPALAQQPPSQRDIPRELTDPATVDKLSNAMQALSDSFLNLPVGELQAAMEGREATAADRRRTVRSESKVSERELRRQIDEAKPKIAEGMTRLAAALPVMMKSLDDIGRAVDRAAANMPDPTYPKR